MSEEKIIYEKIVPRSTIDSMIIGLDAENKKFIIEFGFFKNENIVSIDVSKELTEHMVIDLINNLQATLENFKKIETKEI